MDEKNWLALALEKTVVRRACLCALIVGAIQVTINHGDALIQGNVTPSRVIRMILTMFVPYMVSTVSSVRAMQQRALG
jgi:hypothetical protein